MLPGHHLVAFLLTVYVLILVPAPSVVFVVSRGLAFGRRAALASVGATRRASRCSSAWCPSASAP